MRSARITGILACVLLSCGPGGATEQTPPAPQAYDETIQFRDGTTAQLKLAATPDGLRGALVSGEDVGLALQLVSEAPMKFSADLCPGFDSLIVDLFDFPATISGAVTYGDISETFGKATRPTVTHPIDGLWAIAATYAVSPTQTAYVTGALPIRRHGSLLLSFYSGYAWDTTGIAEHGGFRIPERPECGLAAVSHDERAFTFMQGWFAADFTNAVVWTDTVTGTAVKVVK